MSMGGTSKEREEREQKALDEITAELDAELDRWREKRLNPNAWRLGDNELLLRAEVIVLMDVIKEHLDVTDTELNTRLRKVLLTMIQEIRPAIEAQESQAIRQRLLDGIRQNPNIHPFGPNGGSFGPNGGV